MSQDESAYHEDGFGSDSRIYVPSFEGKPWTLGEFPSDPEITASVFCSLLDYSVNNRRRHLYDLNLPMSEIAKFERKDISFVNRQPNSIFRAHYELYVGNVLYRAPAVSKMFEFNCLNVTLS